MTADDRIFCGNIHAADRVTECFFAGVTAFGRFCRRFFCGSQRYNKAIADIKQQPHEQKSDHTRSSQLQFNNSFVRLQRSKKFADGLSGQRVHQIRRYLAEGLQDKAPLCQARMGDYQGFLVI